MSTNVEQGRALKPRPNFGRLTGVDLKRLVGWWSNWLDMLVYKIWYRRWRRKFRERPEMIVPFMDTMTRWAEKELTPEQIEECRAKWREIVRPANTIVSQPRKSASNPGDGSQQRGG